MSEPFFFTDDEILLPKTNRKTRLRKTLTTGGCAVCPLGKCKSPKMEPYGDGELGIMIVGEQPGTDENKEGRPFIGRSGNLLREMLSAYDIDMDRDCIATNSIQCFASKFDPVAALCCKPRLKKQIQEFSPNLILAVGGKSIEALTDASATLAQIRGKVIASKRYGCWIGTIYHTSHILRQRDDEKGHDADDLEAITIRDLGNILKYLSKGVKKRFIQEESGNEYVISTEEAIDILDKYSFSSTPVAFDYETTCLSPFEKDARILTMSLSNDISKAHAIAFPDPIPEELRKFVAAFLSSNIPKIAHNYSFEDIWSRVVFGTHVNNLLNDTMVTAHIIDDRTKVTGLEFQSYVHFGSDHKKDFGDRKGLQKVTNSLLKYNALDSRYTLALNNLQEKELNSVIQRGKDLFTRALPVLSDMSYRGVLLDVKELMSLREQAVGEINKITYDLLNDADFKLLSKKLHKPITFTNDEIRELVYGIWKIKPTSFTSGGTKGKKLPSVKIDALQTIAETENNNHITLIINDLKQLTEWSHTLQTFIDPYLNMRDSNNFLHPNFNLNFARSYRSSSSNPNFQNVPNHGDIAKAIRKAIIPRYDYLLEVDYSGMEIRIIAAVSGDRSLIKDLERGADLHRIWAARINEISEDDVDKTQRYDAKNGFVFPKFYGQSYEASTKPPLNLSMRKARRLDAEFWREHKGIKDWQQLVIDSYYELGYVELVSGFRRHAPLDHTKIINTPIQGAAFHVLLEGLIKCSNHLKEKGFASLPVAQIHDSVLFDVKENELASLIEIVTYELMKFPDFLPNKVPLEVEWEIGRNWSEMEEM